MKQYVTSHPYISKKRYQCNLDNSITVYDAEAWRWERQDTLFKKKLTWKGIVQVAILFLSNSVYKVENVYGNL